MPEFSHHQTWLADLLPVLTELEEHGPALPSAALRARLEEGHRLCRVILEQNPASSLGSEASRRIEALLHEMPAQRPITETLVEIHNKASGESPARTEEEQRIDERIAAFEKDFLAFGNERFLPLAQKMPRTTAAERALHTAVTSPFRLVRHNQGNPLNNVLVGKRFAREHDLPEMAALLSQPDPLRFAYGDMAECWQKDIAVAGYAPLFRTLFMPAPPFPSSEAEMLAVMHECYHVPQCVQWRAADLEGFARFNDGLGPRPRLIVNHEFQAYGLELEALDLLAGGALRAAALQRKAVDIPWLMQRLHDARPEYENMTKMLCILSLHYFPGGNAAVNAYSEPYKETVRRICIHDGYEVYEVEGGRVVRIS